MKVWTRREALAAGAVGLLAGCSSRPAAGTAPSPSLSSSALASRSGKPDWARLRSHVSGTLSLPGSSAYDLARLVENPRFDGNRPLAVLAVSSVKDVSTGLSFAKDNGIAVALRSGGHSYPGYSSGGGPGLGEPPSLVLDCRRLAAIVPANGTSMRIGAGASLANVYDAVGRRGRAIAGGSCATVGVAGLTQGGGVGVLVRAFGLTCDAVTAMTVVTADGVVRTASANHEPDLYWALRGGGGGHLGVVTSFVFSTFAAPRLTTFYLAWPIGEAAGVIDAWQHWAPTADRRAWSTLKVLGGAKHAAGPIILVSGTWTGPASGLDRQLAGLLDHCPRPSGRSISSRGYLDAMRAYAGCSKLPVTQCRTGPGGGLRRESFGATSHVGYSTLSGSGIATLLDHVHRAQGSGLREAGISMDALGGTVRDTAPGATAFVHRKALMTVQYTATFADGSAPGRADVYVRDFRSAMIPHWGEHAYVNYADRAVGNYRTAYFGANADRLARVKKAYDPAGFFSQPQGLEA